MSVTAFVRLRMFWGGFDYASDGQNTPAYGATEYVSGGASAAVGSGVGVRRATVNFDRTNATPADDAATVHFDFLNMTAGSPDDTWITSDYTTLEAAIAAWITAVKSYVPGTCAYNMISWHRVGSGVHPPNPAERIFTPASPVSGLGVNTMPPQAACNITFRTGNRRNWGRTSLPWGKVLDSIGRIPNADCDAIATATQSLVTTAAASDFHLVVVSAPRNSSLNVEKIEVDNVIDSARRRRWKHTTYRKLLP